MPPDGSKKNKDGNQTEVLCLLPICDVNYSPHLGDTAISGTPIGTLVVFALQVPYKMRHLDCVDIMSESVGYAS